MSLLFEPLQAGDLHLSNRVVMSAPVHVPDARTFLIC